MKKGHNSLKPKPGDSESKQSVLYWSALAGKRSRVYTVLCDVTMRDLPAAVSPASHSLSSRRGIDLRLEKYVSFSADGGFGIA